MSPPTERARSAPGALRRDLVASAVDGCMFSVMVGAAEWYFPLFALALGVDRVTAGLVATVPLLVGAGMQLVSPWAVARLRSNGRWCILSALVQAISLLPLAAAAALGRIPTVLLFAVVSVYFGAGFASGPAWTTWIETLVPRRITSRYFARRATWCNLTLVVSLLGAGAVLEWGEAAHLEFGAFAALFAVAAAARFVSVNRLAAQREPVPQPEGERHLPMTAILVDEEHRPVRRFLVFMLASYFAMQIAVPFLASYFRAELRIPYGWFAVLVAIPYAARIVSYPWFGRIARRYGARRVMWIGAFALVPSAGLLAVSANWWWIAFVQALAGFAMAAFELANLLLWFETIRPAERTSVLTTYQFWYAAAVVSGSAVGSVVLVTFGEGRTAFVVVFLVSAAARLAATALFARRRTHAAAEAGVRPPR